MVSMITIFRHSFIIRQTVFSITFNLIFFLFDLIFQEFDKIPEIKFEDGTIGDKTNKQTNDNIYNSSLGDSCSYDLDDIIGTNYRKRNPKRKISSSKSPVEFDSPTLFKEQCFTMIQPTREINSLESQPESHIIAVINNSNPMEQNSSMVSSFMSNFVKESEISTDLSQKDDVQPVSIETEKNYKTETSLPLANISEIVEEISLELDDKKDDNISQFTKTFIKNGESIAAPSNTENDKPSSIAPVKNDIVEEEGCGEPIANNDDITSSEICIAKTSSSDEAITSISSKNKRLERAAPCVPLSFNTSIPIDIFIEICHYLPPESLFSLMCVCKQFRFWLNSSASYVTQDIWRASRMKYLERIRLRPPIGMDELTYIKLTMLERGCQFCGTKKETPKVYWAFRVRCCRACLRKRITRYIIKIEFLFLKSFMTN